MTEATDSPADEDPGIQVSLLTGFLGSGKTTLLNRLLRHPDMVDSAVLVNEFGDIGIDHLLVESVDEGMVELTTGCLCCAVQGDLTRALRELFLKRARGEVTRFRRVLIETTGLADPAPILHTLINDPVLAHRYFLDGVISTVDGVHGTDELAQHAECRKQTAIADRVVITKMDMADQTALPALEDAIRQLNPAAPILHVSHGDVDPSALFGCGLYDPYSKSFDVQNWLHEEKYHAAHDHDHDHGHDHEHDHHHLDPDRHGSDIQAFCMVYDEPLEWPAFIAWIQTLITHKGENLLRIKGIVSIVGEDKPIAIHGVQHVFHNPVRLPDWPDADRRSRIVFITRGIEQSVIEQSLDALQKAARETAGSH